MPITMIFLFLFLATANSKQLIVDYSRSIETVETQKFFEQDDSGFYVDIGGYDPVMFSITVQLYSRGWKGINVQAVPYQVKSFFYTKPQDINLGIAIGEDLGYEKIYDFNTATIATASQQVLKMQKDKGVQIKQIYDIPSYGMGTLCERFYLQKPKFLNLDIEGLGMKALKTNNWEKDLCRPSIIFSQWNNLSKGAEQTQQEYLNARNYTLIRQSKSNQVFVQNSKLDYYRKAKKESQEKLKNKDVIVVQKLLEQYVTYFKLKNKAVPRHINVTSQEYYLMISRRGEVLDTRNIYLQERKTAPDNFTQQQRPIIILQYNPHYSSISIQTGNFQISTATIGKHQYFKISISPEGKPRYSLFILNQKFEPQLRVNSLPILSPNKLSENQNIVVTDTSVISENSVNKQTQAVSNIWIYILLLFNTLLLVYVSLRVKYFPGWQRIQKQEISVSA